MVKEPSRQSKPTWASSLYGLQTCMCDTHGNAWGTVKWKGRKTCLQFAETVSEYDPPFPFSSFIMFSLSPVACALGCLCWPYKEQMYGLTCPAQLWGGKASHKTTKATHKTESAGHMLCRSVTTQGWTYKMLFGPVTLRERRSFC